MISTDTCIIYIIPAEEKSNNIKRNIWIIKDKDGDWFKSYNNEYDSREKIIFNPK